MAIRVGINGFGRIGRNVLRAAYPDRPVPLLGIAGAYLAGTNTRRSLTVGAMRSP